MQPTLATAPSCRWFACTRTAIALADAAESCFLGRRPSVAVGTITPLEVTLFVPTIHESVVFLLIFRLERSHPGQSGLLGGWNRSALRHIAPSSPESGKNSTMYFGSWPISTCIDAKTPEERGARRLAVMGRTIQQQQKG
jgi:hypothetical protein